MGRSQRHKIEEQGFSSRGEIYEQGAVNDKILASLGGTITGARPVLSSISPTTAVRGGADLTLTATGTGFDTSTKIIFNGGTETTTYVSPTSLTTVVKPSLVSVAPITVPVQVRKGNSLVSAETKYFTFTAAMLDEDAPTKAKAGADERNRGPFPLLRIEPDEEGGAWYVFERMDIEEGDTLRAEATGNSGTNGDFEAVDYSEDIAGETAVYWKDAKLDEEIVGKGRITIL